MDNEQVLHEDSPKTESNIANGCANPVFENEEAETETEVPIRGILNDKRVTYSPGPESLSSEYSETSTKNNSKDFTAMKMPKLGRIAIQVEAAEKSYGKQSILKHLYMTVEEGTIYGLLGSSGCGKTTILSCIVGLRKLDDGRISIFGKSPGSKDSGVPGRLVGYMPQDVALNEEFTMSEVCTYFGRLYGMTDEKVNERVEYLVNLLDLKKCSGRLSNFSGGQKRRASFLIALLHESEILILDEPTVGVDPILRAKIWNHIRGLADTCGTTVIITTHYIEEMRQADRVGIMRGGQLMAEASPTTLMEFHKANMLEEVVLKYCLQSNAVDEVFMVGHNKPRRNTLSFEQAYYTPGSSRNNSLATTQEPQIFIPPPYLKHLQKSTNLANRVWALTRKNLVVLMRNIGFMLFLFLVPAIIVAFFSLAIGKAPKNLSLGFVNEDVSGECNSPTPITCKAEELSCFYINILKSFDIFKLKKHESVNEAIEDVHDKSSWGYVHFSKDFSKHVFDRTLGKSFTNDTVNGSKIRIRLDMSSVSIATVIQKLLYDAYRAFSAQLLTACKVDITGRDLPVEFEKPIYGSEDLTFTTYIVPGIVIGFLPFMSCVSCALSYIIEKKDGMLDRTKVAGVTAFDIILSHAIPQFGISLVQTIVTFVIMYFFNIPYDIGSPFLASLLTLLASVTGMAMGFTAAQLFDEEKNAMLFAMACIFPSFLLSGLLWPTEGLPSAFRVISYFLPGTLAAESIRSILFRGWDLTHFTVYIGFITQFIFIGIFSVLTYVFHRLRK